MKRPFLASIALMLCPLSTVHAQTLREHGTHEHGAGSLAIALENSRIYIDLDSPAYNVLGFESAPSSKAQQAVLDAARTTLESAPPFSFDAAARCLLERVDVVFDLAAESAHADDAAHTDEAEHEHEHEHEHGQDTEGSEESGHAEEEAHADESEHENDHDASHPDESEHADDAAHSDDSEHAHEDESSHSDVTSSYEYQCERPELLEQITTTLFEAFGNFEDIDVQLIGPGGQTGLELIRERSVINLGAVR